jgi:hypothetical protein
MKADPGYHDLAAMMEIRPLQITVLRPGSFRNYYREMERNSPQLALRQPPKMNATDDIIAGLLSPVEKSRVSVTR